LIELSIFLDIMLYVEPLAPPSHPESMHASRQSGGKYNTSNSRQQDKAEKRAVMECGRKSKWKANRATAAPSNGTTRQKSKVPHAGSKKDKGCMELEKRTRRKAEAGSKGKSNGTAVPSKNRGY